VRTTPATVVFDKGEFNLTERCSALAHQVTTIDRSKLLGNPIGSLSEEKLRDLEEALMHYLLF